MSTAIGTPGPIGANALSQLKLLYSRMRLGLPINVMDSTDEVFTFYKGSELEMAVGVGIITYYCSCESKYYIIVNYQNNEVASASITKES